MDNEALNIIDPGSSFNADMIEFLSMTFNCATSDSIAAVNKLFDSVLLPSLGLNPMFQSIVQLQRALLEGSADLFKYLPSIVKMIGLSKQVVEQLQDIDNLSAMVS